MGASAAGNDFTSALASVAPVLVDGFFYRHGNPRYALDAVPPRAVAPSRWQGEGDPAALHASDRAEAAWAEWAKANGGAVDAKNVRRRFGRIRVHVRAVDLRDPDVQNALEINDANLTSDHDESTCRRIAAAARALGVEALLAPSAALDGATTLVVLPGGLHKVSVACERIVAPPT